MYPSVLLILAVAIPQGASAPVISEIAAINDTGIKDEDGERSDWLEVYNPDAVAVDLGGWYLTDDASDLTKWQFPSPTVLAPQAFLVVFASDKDRAISGAELHTNFKFKSSGEYAGLVAADGTTVVHEYAPAFPQQYPDISYGLRFTAGVPGPEESYFSPPTPGQENDSGGPLITDAQHSPNIPLATDSLLVTASVAASPASSIASVFLRYKVMFNQSARVNMTDDGQGADQTAGDGIYSGLIPANIALPAEMIRWVIRATDDLGGATRVPPFPDPLKSAEYLGTLVEDPRITSPLAVYHWFVRHPGLAERPAGTRASLFHAGRFYDNVFVRSRGGSSSSYPKKSYKFDFNTGEHFVWDENERKVEEINLNTTYADKAFIRQTLSFDTYREAGVHGCAAFAVRLQQNGEFYSVCAFVEQPDEDLLIRHGLDPEGALYKMYNQCTDAYAGVEKKTRKWEDHSDLDELVRKIQHSGQPLEVFLFDRVDLPAVVSYIAATTLIHDNDHVAKNYYLYRDSDGDGEWEFLPWDKDLTLGRNYTNSGGVLNDTMWADLDPYSHPLFGGQQYQKVDAQWNRLIDACYREPRVLEMYLARLRTLMNEILQRNGTPLDERYYEQRIAELVAEMSADVALDQAKWGIPAWGAPLDFAAAIAQLQDSYLRPRRRHLHRTHSALGGIIPPSQGYPHLSFGVVESDPASGNQDEEYIEIVNGNGIAVDLSGWTLSGGIDFEFAAGSVIPSNDSAYVSPHVATFRNRPASPTGGEGLLVLGPYSGHLAADEDLNLIDHEGVLVTTTGDAVMTHRNMVAKETGILTVVGMNPGDVAVMLMSFTGSGPTDTPYGIMDLSLPIYFLGFPVADDAGTAEVSFDLPAGAAGLTLWLQSLDQGAGKFTNGLEVTIR